LSFSLGQLGFGGGGSLVLLGQGLLGQVLQALVAGGVRTGAQGAGLVALVDDLEGFAGALACSTSWAISMNSLGFFSRLLASFRR
jgi:hypothetical protein